MNLVSRLSRSLRALRRAVRGDVPPAAPWEQTAAIPEMTDHDRAIVAQVLPYTMTSPERIFALTQAVRYVVARSMGGAFVECGVWRGGSVLAMILTLQELGVADRPIYLYDTFEGMTAPTSEDRSAYEPPAMNTWLQAHAEAQKPWQQYFDPQLFSLEGVRSMLARTGYPLEQLHFVQGPVERTLPDHAPERIALLRLDTDWYESTRHELTHLYPRLASGGVLIVDDYGHWEGCRRAVDEYFGSRAAQPVLLNRVDYTCRIAIKS